MQSTGCSSSASPSSSSSTHLGLDPAQHQQQQQQQQLQLAFRQSSLQQQFQQQQQQQQQLRKAEGEESLLAYQHGVSGSSIPMAPQAGRKLVDLPPQHGSSQLRDDSQSKGGQGAGHHSQNAMHQAYLQYALQAQHKSQPHQGGNLLMQQQQHAKFGMLGNNSFKMQDLMSVQGATTQSQGTMFKKPGTSEKQQQQVEPGQTSNEERNELRPPPHRLGTGQLTSVNMIRPPTQPQAQQQSSNNHLGMAQWQAIQAWARENNIDLSVPANVNLMNQLLPLWQSARMAAVQKQNETAVAHQSTIPSIKNLVVSSSAANEISPQGNSTDGLPAQAGSVKGRLTHPSGSISTATGVNSNVLQMQQQPAARNRESQKEKAGKSLMVMANGESMQTSQAYGSISNRMEQSNARKAFTSPETSQTQQLTRPLQQMNQPVSQPAVPSSEGVGLRTLPKAGSVQTQKHIGLFTEQQLHVLKAQILAFKRIKRGERSIPQEVLQAIVPLPLDLQLQQAPLSSGVVNQEKAAVTNVEEHAGHVKTNDMAPQLTLVGRSPNLPNEEATSREDKVAMVNHMQGAPSFLKERLGMPPDGNVEHNSLGPVKSEQEAERGSHSISTAGVCDGDKGKSVSMNTSNVDSGQVKKETTSGSTPLQKDAATRKYHGPLFDFLSFTRKHDGSTVGNYSSNMALAYDVKDLLIEEGKDVLKSKRTENLKKISGLLAINLERKRIKPDLVLRLQIEEKKLRLLDFQARLRDEVDQEQQEIMAMPDRPYRTFVRQCERQRIDLLRQVQQLQKVSRDKQLKSIFQWRKKLLEAHWAIRDARTTRNRGVAKYHERMLREFSKRKDDDRNKRMEALKNNDVDRYRQMLMEQQTSVPGDAAERYSVLSSFLSQTEEYLHKLGGKITAAKNNQEVEEAANAAARAARSQGLSEEEIKAAAACAREEVMIRNRFSEMNAPKESASVNKYYNLAHAVNESVLKQPSMLRAGTLREYQLVGLQWMLSLYNNKLNGILADEMGLGKTVQVMALIAYLMEFKGNYGPHLIIVPNAVLVNWKSELHSWLPSVKCIFYVGAKDQRSKLFSHEVVSVKFNVLVTTYEFVMYDRSKLSKINWKYIIIDEAQRMKDRESVLARDLDRYRCQRRLLLTGTPLQNDLKELWSLLNLLLPEVFDNRKAFHDWFAKPFQKDGPSPSPEEDDWLETEKKVIIIHRLHQILEPFMLRRRVEDVEGSLPRKVSIVLRCRMSAIQGTIYDWIKSTGTIRVDPEDEMRRVEKNPAYQVKMYKNLNNKCMELRKVCNHPLLNYPYFNDYSKDFIVRSCGKLWVLDRILIKLHRAGHRVLLFSTMTKLLDLLEEYLQWRRLVYRRIDGTTSLEDRESAIVDFNSLDSNCFIFLLSIRAAGRGLNLQTADTVVIYDPDPNPQNEEQAVARAHRIGQKREVKVIYMEAVVDKNTSFQKEDELRNGSTGDSEDDLVGKDRYMGSIESLIRNNIQQYKIDMADEVINAGRFDQRTTHEERRMTLETLLHDEERNQENVHDVPSLREVNRMIARSEEEVELFDQMDEEFDWTREMVKYNQVPKWLRAGSKEVNAVVASLSKKPSKNILATNSNLDSSVFTSLSPSKTERRGRPKRNTNKHSIYREYDEEEDDDDDDVDGGGDGGDGDHSDASSEEEKASLQDEEVEKGEFECEETGAVCVAYNDKDQSEEEGMICEGGGYESSRVMEGSRSVHMFEEAGSTGSSGSRRLREPATPSMSSQKFASLSALDTKSGHISKKMTDELEEGEIAVSGDSHVDRQRSGSWIHDRDDGEEEQVLQPKIKRKRSIRIRPRYNVERLEEKSSNERVFSPSGSKMPSRGDHNYDMQLGAGKEIVAETEPTPDKNDMKNTSLKQRHSFASRKVSPVGLQKPGRLSYPSEPAADVIDHSSCIGNVIRSGGPSSLGSKMSDSTQRKCKNVISKFQRKIDKDGHQILPALYDLWKRNERSSFASPMVVAGNLLDLQKIELRVDGSEYNNVMDFVADVQLMLKNFVRCSNYSHEVRDETGKLEDLFFNIMKIAFPDIQFRESKDTLTFSGPGGPAGTIQSLKQVTVMQGKRHSQINKMEADLRPSKSMPRGTDDEEGRPRGYASKPGKEASFSTSSAGGREQGKPESGSVLAHPGDLVTCKKKRKDREKQRACTTSPSSNLVRVGPLSPPPVAQVAYVPQSGPGHSGKAACQKDARPLQHSSIPARTGGSSVSEVKWAKPVKRTRTDTGKRRPYH